MFGCQNRRKFNAICMNIHPESFERPSVRQQLERRCGDTCTPNEQKKSPLVGTSGGLCGDESPTFTFPGNGCAFKVRREPLFHSLFLLDLTRRAVLFFHRAKVVDTGWKDIAILKAHDRVCLQLLDNTWSAPCHQHYTAGGPGSGQLDGLGPRRGSQRTACSKTDHTGGLYGRYETKRADCDCAMTKFI